MTSRANSERTQVRTNSLASLGYFVLNAGVSLWLVPYLIGALGIEGFGLIALALSLTAYLNLVAGSANSSISRFLAMDINREDFARANETFNSALVGVAIGIAVLTPLLWIACANVASFIEVPPALVPDTPWLFFLLIVGFFITFCRNIFTVPAFANNRLDLVFASQGLEIVARVAAIVLMFRLLSPNVRLVGIAIVIGAIVAILYGLYLWRSQSPYLGLDRKAFRIERFSEMFSMSGWMTINQTGAILFLNVDLLVANLLLGAAAVGYYGAILQISVALRSLSGLLAGVVTPLIFARYAKEDTVGLVSVARSGVKYLGLAVALPVGIVCAAADPILTLWLGPEFAAFVPLVWVMMFHLSANVACRPLFAVQLAASRVKMPAVVTLLLGVAHVLLSVALVRLLDWGLYGIAASGAITLTLKNSVYTLIHAAKILDRPLATFAIPIALAILGAAVAAVTTRGALLVTGATSWFGLLAAAALTTLVYGAIAWGMMLDRRERRFLLDGLLGRA